LNTPELERAIENILQQVRAELIRLYSDGDIGTVCVHCGKQQMRVKAAPERIHEPEPLKTQ
jgi:hypothetical protein